MVATDTDCLGVANYTSVTVDRFPKVTLKTTDSSSSQLDLLFSYQSNQATPCIGTCSGSFEIGTMLTPCVNAGFAGGDQARQWTPPQNWSSTKGQSPGNCANNSYTVMDDDTLTATMTAKFHFTGTVKPDTGGQTANYTKLPQGCTTGGSTFNCYVNPGS